MMFATTWSTRTERLAMMLLSWLGLGSSKFRQRERRYRKPNEHNARIPHHWWFEDWKKEAIVLFHDRCPCEGYRRLTFMMLDEDVVGVSPSTVDRGLKSAGRLDRWNRRPSKKGSGFVQPKRPHSHWYVDISYLNIGGTFYYLCSIPDGYCRHIVYW